MGGIKLVSSFLVLLNFCGVYSYSQSPDKLFSHINQVPSFQSIAIENYKGQDSILFYVGFDNGINGLIKTYWWEAENRIKEVNSFSLPAEFDHPNDLQLVGDNLLVTGWSDSFESYIGWFDKKTGDQLRVIKEDLTYKKMKTQFSFLYKDVLHRGLYDGSKIELEYLNKNGYFMSINKDFKPRNADYQNQPIQGSKVIDNKLALLSSFPTRIDIYNIDENFRYHCSYFGEYNPGEESTEPEGLGIVQYKNDTLLFYGLRYPNRINYINFSCFRKHCIDYSYSVGGKKEQILIKPFSNIIDDISEISYKVLIEIYLSIKIIDMKGKVVANFFEGTRPIGNYTFHIPNNKFPKGIYILRFDTEDSSFSRRLVFMN